MWWVIMNPKSKLSNMRVNSENKWKGWLVLMTFLVDEKWRPKGCQSCMKWHQVLGCKFLLQEINSQDTDSHTRQLLEKLFYWCGSLSKKSNPIWSDHLPCWFLILSIFFLVEGKGPKGITASPQQVSFKWKGRINQRIWWVPHILNNVRNQQKRESCLCITPNVLTIY